MGFATLAGLALAVLAGVVLLPPYARLAEAEYQLACLQADVADAEALVAANQRLIDELPHDNVLAMRIAYSQFGLAPELIPPDQQIVPAAGPPQPLVTIARTPRPAAPDGCLVRAGHRLTEPARRRGLLMLSGVVLAAALLCFLSPPKRHAVSPEDPLSADE